MSDKIVPITYSTIDKHFLLDQVQKFYDLPSIRKIQFYRRGLNDTYLIFGDEKKYLLRVYRRWRSADDVGFEMEWLRYLNLSHSPSMQVLPKKDKTLFTCVDAPEGTRCFVLFPFLEDVSHQPLTQVTAYKAGESLAKIHLNSKMFKSKYKRFELDADHLIDEPLQGINAWYQNSPVKDKLIEIHEFAKSAKSRIQSLSKNDDYFGPCQGDTHFGNVMFTEKKESLWFDFDCCGMGWWIYDLAAFYWALKVKWAGWHIDYADTDEIIWNGFLKGYQSLRQIEQVEKGTLSAFVIARGIWALGLHPNNIDDWTSEGCEDGGEFLMKHIELFHDAQSDFLRI